MAELVLVRHGETEWSRTGKHTGTTDLPLTDHGRRQAAVLGAELGDRDFALVLASPRRRAQETADLAGLDDRSTDPDLAEWDYGGYEGLTSNEIAEKVGAPWTVFFDGVVPGATPGESLQDVAARAAAVLARVGPVLEDGGDVALVGHGHHLRVLVALWLGLDPEAGAHFVLDAGTVSRLGWYHEVPAVLSWNVVAD